MKTLLLIFLIIENIQAEVGEFSQRYSEQALDQRLCVSLVVGHQYLENSLSAIMDKYIKFYNEPEKYRFKREKYRKEDEPAPSDDKANNNTFKVLSEKDIKVKF